MEEPSALLLLEAKLAEALARAERAEALLVAREQEAPSAFLELAAEELQRSEKLMRAVFTGSSDAMVLLDIDGRFVDVNPVACAVFTASRAAILRHGDAASAATAAVGPVLRRALLGGAGSERGRIELASSAGATRSVDYICTRNIRAGLHLAVLRDVTEERKQAESLRQAQDDVRRSEARFRAMVEKSAEAVVLFSQQGRVLYASAHDLLGVSPEELVGHDAFGWIHPDDHQRVMEAIAQLVTDGSAIVEFRGLQRDGSHRWLEATGTNFLDDPDIAGLITNIRDITARKLAEAEREHFIETLTFERSRLGALLEKAPAFMAVVRGPEHVFELANEAYYDIVGRHELIGRRLVDAIPHVQEQGFLELFDRVLNTGEPFHSKGLAAKLPRVGSSGGETRFVNVILQPLVEADGTRSGVFIHGVDVTEETIAQRRVRAQFNGVPVPTYAWRRVDAHEDDFVLLDYNEAAVHLSRGGIAEFVGRSARDVFALDEDVLADLWRCIDTGETFQREIERTTKTTNELKKFLITYSPAPPDVVLAHTEDITERKKTEDQLRQAQKMEAIGALAGGVAHDFNNMLSVILSYTDLMLDELPHAHPIYPDLEQVKMAGHRAVELTQQLMTFSRQQIVQPRALNVSETVLGLEKMLRRLVREDVEIVVHPDSTSRVWVDRGQLEQVIMNLLINAGDAMPEGGRVTVSTSDVDLVDPLAGEPMTTPPGSYVMLCVCDVGVGMDAATRARIFEPFFTTKAVGKGTGLGLATVFGIVQQSGGTIAVESVPGAGTAFRVYLPATRESAVPSQQLLNRAPARGDETVLLVEDEYALRALAKTVLSRAGYFVIEAHDGQAALDVANRTQRTIHLLVTDVVMPRIGGRDLAQRLRGVRPEMKVLFTSGYTDDLAFRQEIADSREEYLRKPFTPDTLLRKVRDVLDSVRT